ncbi:MAG: efflux RND transporter periplasmic adaptor subunit [Chloroflexi bacterium]|nr:efflux RND transporter periplasmic adaptor subunit [Chloroflexota bacterium]
MRLNRRWIGIGIVIVLLIGIPTIAYLLAFNGPSESNGADEELQTAIVRQGDLVLFASGSGSLVPGREVDLRFGASGPVAELNVQVGDVVEAGDVLAVAGDREQLEAAVASDELALLEAQEALDAIFEGADLTAAEALLALGKAKDALEDAQRTWQNQQEGYRASSTTIKAAEAEVTVAKAKMNKEEGELGGLSHLPSDDPQRAQAYKDFAAAQQRYWSALANLNWYTGHPTETQQNLLDGELALAEAQLAEAQAAQDLVIDGPDPTEIRMAELKVAKAEAELAVSLRNLEESVIVAPFGGTILEVTADVGDTVSGPFIKLADLSLPHLEVFLDETDADKFAIGYEAEIIFDALPDAIFTGRVIQVDPSLNTQGGVSTVQGLIQLDMGATDGLLIGMNAAVDVVGGRAEGVPLVPIEALRELGPGEFAVFVLRDGEPRLTPVEVGLMDFTFAEIISGLEVGETITTGIVVTG